MKKLIVMAVFATAMTACTSFSNRGTVEKPFIAAADTDKFSIDKIELTDSVTEVHAVVHFTPGWWITLNDSSMHIVANGEKFPINETRGIKMMEQVIMPDSGVIRFSLIFPAIPADAESIDFIESAESDWKLWGIDLTGEASEKDNLALIPDEAMRPFSGKLPDAKIEFDSTTINVTLAGYRPGMKSKYSYYVNTLHGQVPHEDALTVNEKGEGKIKVGHSAPVEIILVDGRIGIGSCRVNPGENIDLYCDMHRSGKINMLTRDGVDPFEAPYAYSWSTGNYGNLENEWADKDVPSFDIYSGEFGDYRMSGSEYADYLIKTYNDKLAELEKMNLSAAATEFLKLSLQMELYESAVNADMIYRMSYYAVHNNWGAPLPTEDWDNEIPTEKLHEIASLIELNNPQIMLPINDALAIITSQWTNADIDLGIANTVYNYAKAYNRAEAIEASPEEITILTDYAPAMADEVIAHYKAKMAELAALDANIISETPIVSNEKLFEAIIAPHKGKVVLVDLWNTWCGPCRRALKQNEPEKAESGKLSSDDIVWIYIADESSPLPLQVKTASEIRGIHYRLTPEQIATIREQFNVDGIPYYILVDKDGKYEGRPDLRDHDLFIKEINSKL